jgi:hypothetical protein
MNRAQLTHYPPAAFAANDPAGFLGQPRLNNKLQLRRRNSQLVVLDVVVRRL